jgi:hypothetical protein
VEWILFALFIVLIAVVGIGIGLFAAGRLSRWGDRAVAKDDDTFMTAVGPVDGDTREGHEAGSDGGSGGSDDTDGGGTSVGDGGGGGDDGDGGGGDD